jgi:fermentation-respiration switch protein FrsA (DUF1100 family)
MSEPAIEVPRQDRPETKRPAFGKRLLKRTMTYAIIIYLIWLVIAWFIQRPIMFPASMTTSRHASPPVDAELLEVQTPVGTVEAWLLLGDGVSEHMPGPLVIFAHGNAELIDDWAYALADYPQMGISVLLVEYRGYGRSAGSPSQKTLTQDLIHFHDTVTARPDIDANRVIIHGRSIGGSIAASLAAQRPPAALILQSSPSSITSMAGRLLVPWFLVRDPFDSVAVVKAYDGPVLIMHGTADTIIDPKHAHKLHAAAKHSTLILYDVDHNTLPPAGPYWADVEQFLIDADILE